MAVRRESVKLELEDHFTREVLGAAAAVETLDGSLDSLSGTSVQTSRTTQRISKDIDGIGSSARRATPTIDNLSGRLGLLVRAFAAVGPGIIPVGAVGVAGIAGIANQLGFATIAAGTAVIAFRGVGDALEAVNKAALEPTAENLRAAREAMQELDPAARGLVRQLQDMRPLLESFTSTASGAMFPGLVAGLREIEKIGPQVNGVLDAVGSTLGDMFAAAGQDLSSGRWDDFFQMLATEARPTLENLGSAIGSVVHGLSELWEAFAPLNRDFGSWLADAARGFDKWATGLKKTEGFREFVEYVQTNGPIVADAVVAIANAVLQITEAAAPLGGPILKSLTGIANALAAFADSPAGTPIMAVVTALSALSLVSGGITATLTRVNSGLATIGAQGPRTASALDAVYRAGVGLAGLEIGTAIMDDLRLKAIGAAPEVSALATALREVDTSALSEELGGSLSDILAAADQGSMEGFATDVGNLVDSAGLAGDAFKVFAPQITHTSDQAKKAQQATESLDSALAQLVATSGPDQAQAAFRQLAAAEGLTTAEQKRLITLLPQYSDALSVAGAEIGKAEGSTKRYARASVRARQDFARMNAEMQELRTTARDSASAFLDFSDALAGDTFSFDKWLDAFDKQVAAIAKWRDNIDALRDRGLAKGVLKGLLEEGIEGAAQAVDALANGGQAAIERLNRSFRRGRGEIKGLGDDAADSAGDLDSLVEADRIAHIGADTDEFDQKNKRVKRDLDSLDGRPANPEIGADTDPFDFNSARVKGMMQNLDSMVAQPEIRVASNAQQMAAATTAYLNGILDEDVFIDVRRRYLGDQGIGPERNNDGGVAEGGTIMGPRQPYGDKVWKYLAPGEEVISNRHGQADRHRALLKAINSSRGGTVSAHAARHMASARPMSASGGQVVRHVFEHRVRVDGRMDARQAVTEFRAEMHKVSTDVSRGEISAHENWKSDQSGGAW